MVGGGDHSKTAASVVLSNLNPNGSTVLLDSLLPALRDDATTAAGSAKKLTGAEPCRNLLRELFASDRPGHGKGIR